MSKKLFTIAALICIISMSLICLNGSKEGHANYTY